MPRSDGAWDDRYPTTLVNSRTVSIEHHDNGGRTAGSGKGVVPEAVITASIALDALLLRGDLAEHMAAGIRFRAGTETAITRELRAIPIDRHHLIDHHYIAGRREPAMVLALVQAVIALVVAFGLSLAPDQIGAILAVTAVVLGLITRSRVSPAS